MRDGSRVRWSDPCQHLSLAVEPVGTLGGRSRNGRTIAQQRGQFGGDGVQVALNYGGHQALLTSVLSKWSEGCRADGPGLLAGKRPARAFGRQAAAPTTAGRIEVARSEYAIRALQEPEPLQRWESTYGVSVRPSNSMAGG